MRNFAIAGVATVVDKARRTASIGISGVAAKPYRAAAVELALGGNALTMETVATAAAKAFAMPATEAISYALATPVGVSIIRTTSMLSLNVFA